MRFSNARLVQLQMDSHDRVSKKSQDPEFSFIALPIDDLTSTNPTPTESVCDSCEVH